MEIFTVPLADPAATRAFAAALAPRLRGGDVIALAGDLGMGKTELARGLIQTLAGADIDVPSPTFTLVQPYDLPGLSVWHCDLYRLDGPAAVRELGLEEAADALLLIEWPDRLGRDLPRARLTLTLSAAGNGRILHASGPDPWPARLKGLAE